MNTRAKHLIPTCAACLLWPSSKNFQCSIFFTFIYCSLLPHFLFVFGCERAHFSTNDYCSSCSEDNFACNEADEDWMDVYEEVVDTRIETPSRFKISSTVKARSLLSDDNINLLLVGDTCTKSRKCASCPNDRECADALGKIKVAREIIRDFRRRYWNISECKGQVRERRQNLLDDIDAMKVVDQATSKLEIQFKISGIFVCKSFFWVRNEYI